MAALIKRMSIDLLMPEFQVHRLAISAPNRYKVYEIPKKGTDEKREIAQPAREIKKLQYWAIKNVLSSFSVHPAATAYCKGKNILDNAIVHSMNKYLLKLDFRHFFPSIVADDLLAFFNTNTNTNELSIEDQHILYRLLFRKSKLTGRLELSIGAPSSPILSNILLYNFDSKVFDLCKDKDVNYTRYADDLAFSTNKPNVLTNIHEEIDKICKKMRSPQLILNPSKTVYTSKKHRRRITGLIITNDGKISLGHLRKREIRAALHNFIAGKLNPEDRAKLAGLFSFAKNVEPDFAERMVKRYGSINIETLFKTF